MSHPQSLARAGFTGSPVAAAVALFEACLANPSGVIFAVDEWGGPAAHIRTKDKKVHLRSCYRRRGHRAADEAAILAALD